MILLYISVQDHQQIIILFAILIPSGHATYMKHTMNEFTVELSCYVDFGLYALSTLAATEAPQAEAGVPRYRTYYVSITE